jgi:hypothetical protein
LWWAGDAYATITPTIMVRYLTRDMGQNFKGLVLGALIAVLASASVGVNTAYAELTNRSPNKLDVSSNGVSGAVSHLLKHEDVVTIKEIQLAAYYPDSAGSSGSDKVLKIRYGEDGKKCNIANIGSHFGQENAFAEIKIVGTGTKEYKVPIEKVCDNEGSTRTNVQDSGGSGWKNNKFFADYPFPNLPKDSATGLYKADIYIKYSNGVNKGEGQANSVNFIAVVGGSNKAKIGPVGADSGGTERQFGLRSAFVGDAQKRDIFASTQFGIPCDISSTSFKVKLYDPDTHIFGETFMWVTENGKKLPRDRYEVTPGADQVNWTNNDIRKWKSTGKSGPGSTSSLKIINGEKGATYKLFIDNPKQPDQNNPNQNVLSIGLPYDSIYGDIDCDSDTSGPEFTPFSTTPELVEPNGVYQFNGRITGGNVPKKPSDAGYRDVEFEFHKIQYKPGVNPYGAGTSLTTRAVDDLDCSYFNGPSSNAGNTRCVTQDPAGSGTMPMTDGTASNVRSGRVSETFPDDPYSQEPGSTICYAVSVKRPSEVMQHDYKIFHSHYLGKDEDGVDVYNDETHDRTDYYYRDEGHDHKNSGDNPYTGGTYQAAVKREWATAVSCVMVGKRPRVQVLSNDLRVRQSDVVARVNSYDDGKYYGSWIEYGTFVFGRDADIASGAGLRNGSDSDIDGRSEWSKLTFANLDTYGDYTTLGTQSQPDIANHVDLKTEDAPGVPDASEVELASLPGSIYRSSGTTTIRGNNNNISGTKLLHVNGTARINSNITLRDGPYSSPADMPQVIIVANNIDIADSVSRIDAWLITYEVDDGNPVTPNGGIIDTCYNGPAFNQRNLNACNQRLEINGATMSSKLALNRTGPVAFDLSAAAETFRGRLDAYVWAYENQRKSSANTAQTVDIVEAPARF